MRLSLTIAFLLTNFCIEKGYADHHHKAWWKFFEGSWTFEVTDNRSDEVGRGKVTYTRSPVGSALLGQWQNEDGTTSCEMSGWQAGRDTMLSTGYGTAGNYWQISLTEIGEEEMRGSEIGRLPDGTTYEGQMVVKKISDDEWSWTTTAKSSEGQEIKATGKVTRAKQDSAASQLETVRKEAFGKWSREQEYEGETYRFVKTVEPEFETVSVYGPAGELINKWKTQYKITIEDSVCRFHILEQEFLEGPRKGEKNDEHRFYVFRIYEDRWCEFFNPSVNSEGQPQYSEYTREK